MRDAGRGSVGSGRELLPQDFDVEFDVVVAGGGSAGCVLATRLTENPSIDAVPDRGRRARPQSVDPHSLGLRQAGAQPERQLGLRDGARAASQRPAPQLAARQGARRLGLDQRPRVPARRAERLRRLGGPGRQGLGLQGRAALLQAHGAQRPRRRRLSRPGRTDDHLRHQEALRQRQGVRGGVHAAPVPAQPRFQRRAHRRGRHGAAQRAQRLALLDGGGLPQAQSQAQEPQADDAHAGAPHPVRGQARDRRRGRGGRHRQAHRRAARGDRVGRLDQLAGAADELRGRAGCRAASGRHRGASRSAGRRQEPAGSRAGTVHVPDAAAGNAERDPHLAAVSRRAWRSSG